MKAISLALLFAPILVLAAPSFQGGHAHAARHLAGLSGPNDAHLVSPYTPHAKRGPAKSRHCKARIASISLASVSSTSVHAKQTPHTTTTTTHKPKPTEKDDNKGDDKGSSGDSGTHTGDATVYGAGLVRKQKAFFGTSTQCSQTLMFRAATSRGFSIPALPHYS